LPIIGSVLALKDDHLAAIREAGFADVDVLSEAPSAIGSWRPDAIELVVLNDPTISTEELRAAEAQRSATHGAALLPRAPHARLSSRWRTTGGEEDSPMTHEHLFVLNDAPYGTERSYNALRWALALLKRPDTSVRVFLLGDAVACALRNQETPQGTYNVERMIRSIAGRGAVAT